MYMPKFNDKEKEKAYKKQYDRDHTMVKGKFSNLETKGAELTFPFHKYPEDQVRSYSLIDGNNYELPYMVAKHLAVGVFTPVHINERNADGKRTVRINSKNHRTNFQKLDFEDADFTSTNIVTVEIETPEIAF